MKTTKLLEAATLVSEAAADDGTWKVRLISEGRGSSGIYPRELLENHHSALDNVLSFKNHPTGWDGPQDRDFTMIVGEIVGETWIEQDERGLTAVYGNYLPDPDYASKLERYRKKIALSIFIEGSGYEDENGDFVVDWFNPEDPYASLDVVLAAGARGKFMESQREFYSEKFENKNPGTRQVSEKKEFKMDQEMKDAFAALTALITPLATAKEAAAEAEAQKTADESAVTSAIESYSAAITAIDAADLLPVQVESLRTAAKAGQDVAPLIESAKAVKQAAIEAVKESANQDGAQGVILGESAGKSFAVSGWGK